MTSIERSFMRVTGVNSVMDHVAGEDARQLQRLRTQVQSLGDGSGREFSVVRDPDTQRFVVQIIDSDSRTVIDQFPSENMLKRLPGTP